MLLLFNFLSQPKHLFVLFLKMYNQSEPEQNKGTRLRDPVGGSLAYLVGSWVMTGDSA